MKDRLQFKEGELVDRLFLSGSVFEFGRVNGLDANVIRVLAEKYRFKVAWKLRRNLNVGLSPLDLDARDSLTRQ